MHFARTRPEPATLAPTTVSSGAASTPQALSRPLIALDVNDFFSPTGGGVRRYHTEKLQHLGARSDVSYHLVVPSDRFGQEQHGGATLHYIPALPLGKSGYRAVIDPLALRRIIRQVRPDVIEVGSPYLTPDLVRLASAGTGARLVGFWHAHYPDAYLRRPLAKQPLLSRTAERIGWWWAARTYGRFDATIAAADCLRDELAHHGVRNVSITPLGVDLELFTPERRDTALRASWGAGDDDVVVCFPHRLCGEKRLSTMIDAFRTVAAIAGPRARLVFAGRGPGEPEVQALLEAFPGQVHHLGFVDDRQQMARVLASADVVAALSPTETFGLSAAEAMACGTALIGVDALSVGELLRQSRGGLVVPDLDPRALAAAWLQLLDPALTRRYGARAQAFALAHFDWRETFDRIVAVYRSVVKGEPARLDRRPHPVVPAPLAWSGGGPTPTPRRPRASHAADPRAQVAAPRASRDVRRAPQRRGS